MIETKFKETELGKIPVDWTNSIVADIFEMKRNNTLSRSCLNYTDIAGIKNIHYGDVLIKFGAFIDVSSAILPFVNREIQFSPSYLQSGDIIIADTAEDETVGKASEVINIQDTDKIVAGLHTIVLHPLTDFAPKFLGYYFNGHSYHHSLRTHMQGTKVISISKRALNLTTIAYPSNKQEQTRIAAALSDVEALIAELGVLIEKKRAIMTATMQDLLTARRRLPGFVEQWRTVQLKDIAKMQSGGTPSTAIPSYYTGNIPFLGISDMTASKKYLFATQKHITEEAVENSSARIFPAGTFLMSMYASIGKCVISSIEIAISQAILGFYSLSSDIDKDFLYYKLSYFSNDLTTSGQTGTQSNLNKRIVQNYTISIPCIKEQQAIATILSDMDAEIVELEAKRDKYVAIRQGMMQQLLTGKIRLI